MQRSSIPTAIVDAFTRTAGHGNRAGVVPDADRLEEAALHAAARAVAASETAFVLTPQPGADLRLRYFTPSTEIEFCGHATVACFHRLVETDVLRAPGAYRLDTRAGRLDVELEAEGGHVRVWIATPRHPWERSPIAPADLVRLLGGGPDMLDPALPVERSGPKIFVPLARRDHLHALSPRWDDLAGAGLEHGVHGFYAFTREAADPRHVSQGRFFAPAVGIREDPATGAASGPLAEYLALHGVLALPPGGGVARARAEQGDAMGKPGRLDLEVTGAPREITRVRVGGSAVTVIEGMLRMGE